ncbi:LysR family transcriptional regulator [Pseudoalteromonas xiamenensis]|uniref:LysR family transcriptional regulator n=1 Tax=Pseudoalteromonas xiamenensis TaxID=882626 RepID=UPI0035E5A047
MDIESLRSLLAFVETGSITRAAKQAFRTQAAISMQMKKLEMELGKPIFVKNGRNLNLTAEGQQLARYARRLVSLHDETLLAVKNKSIKHVVRVGCPDDYVDAVLPKLVNVLNDTFDEIEIQVVCGPSYQLRIMLDSGQLDLAIVSRVPASEEGFLLLRGQGIWAGLNNSILVERDVIPITVFEKDCKFHQAAIEGLIKLATPFNIVVMSQSFSAQKSVILGNQAIGAMADISCQSPLVKVEHAKLPSLPVVELALIIANIPNAFITNDLAFTLARKFEHANLHEEE